MEIEDFIKEAYSYYSEVVRDQNSEIKELISIIENNFNEFNYWMTTASMHGSGTTTLIDSWQSFQEAYDVWHDKATMSIEEFFTYDSYGAKMIEQITDYEKFYLTEVAVIEIMANSVLEDAKKLKFVLSDTPLVETVYTSKYKNNNVLANRLKLRCGLKKFSGSLTTFFGMHSFSYYQWLVSTGHSADPTDPAFSLETATVNEGSIPCQWVGATLSFNAEKTVQYLKDKLNESAGTLKNRGYM